MVDVWTWLGGFFTTDRLIVGLIAITLSFVTILLFGKYWKGKQVPKGGIPPLMPE